MSSDASALQDVYFSLGKRINKHIPWSTKEKKKHLSVLCLKSLFLDKIQQINPSH